MCQSVPRSEFQIVDAGMCVLRDTVGFFHKIKLRKEKQSISFGVRWGV